MRRYAVTGSGLKLRIHPLAAALAVDQLSQLDDHLAGRKVVAERLLGSLRQFPWLAVPEIPPGTTPSWYALALRYEPTQLDGIPPHRLVAALRAEGVDADQPGSTRPLNDHPLFESPNRVFPILPEGWPRYRPGQFPAADGLVRHSLKIPVPHYDDGLVDAYLKAFEKIWAHRHELSGDETT